MSDFNILFILIPLIFVILLFLKPFRRFIGYLAKNIASVIFLAIISITGSIFGLAIPLNIVSLGAALLLGLPGISLALVLSLII